MDIVNISEINYKNYNKCLKVTNNLVEVIILIENEVKIVKYGYINGNNHFEDTIYSIDKSDVGGHRFGCIPTIDHKIDFIDDEGVKYEKIPNGVRVIQNIEKWTQIRKILEITFEEHSSKVTVSHKIISLNAFDINLSISSTTMVKSGGIEIIPLNRNFNDDLPDKALIFWPYSNLKDSRVYFGDKYIAMKVNENISEKFRIGINTNLKYALYYNNNEMFIKEFNDVDDLNTVYPNMGCNYESLITSNYLEMQTNSPISKLSTNKCLTHVETWNIYKNIELDFIDKFIEQYDK